MSSSDPSSPSDLAGLTAEIVSAYLSQNSSSARDLPEVIASVHAALSKLDAPLEPAPEPLVPPVPIKKTIGPDYIISLEDGRRYKTLKRHLAGHGLTPQQYRERWGLPSDYPMVAPDYAAQRSTIARQLGLGRKRDAAASGSPPPSDDADATADQPEVAAATAPKLQSSPEPKARSRARSRTVTSRAAADQPEPEAAEASGSEPNSSPESRPASKAKPRRRPKVDAEQPA